MYRLVHGQLLNIIEVVTPNQIALVTTTAYSVQGYDSDVPIEIESIPEKNEPAGTQGELHYINGSLVWQYVAMPPDPDEELAKAISAATTLEELKKALIGTNGNKAKVKGELK